MTRAVFFDVDFTLIYPGPTFLGEGYQQFCERHGLQDIEGALRIGMGAVLLCRGRGCDGLGPAWRPSVGAVTVPVIRSLQELPALLQAPARPSLDP
jgi:hypothetical protein